MNRSAIWVPEVMWQTPDEIQFPPTLHGAYQELGYSGDKDSNLILQFIDGLW
jgi:hypothetical protein